MTSVADMGSGSTEAGQRPAIGITTVEQLVPTRAGEWKLAGVATEYGRAVWEAGGLPVLLPTLPEEAAPGFVQSLDGLLLTGGGDVHPELYGREPHEQTYDVDQRRDAFERALIQACIGSSTPLLAVCRGIQILNVSLGGSLIPHLPDIGVEHWTGFDRTHPVRLDGDSRLAGIYGETALRVNSIHHQGLDRVANGLQAVGRSEDGVVEAVEWSEPDRWVVGIQWHAERPWASFGTHEPLFQELVHRAAQRRAGAQPGPPRDQGALSWTTGS